MATAPALLPLAIGGLLLYLSLPALRATLDRRRYRTVRGTIAESTVLAGEDATERQRERTDGLTALMAFADFVADVRYEYRVDGQTHVGETVSPFDGGYRKRAQAEAVVDRYRRGSQVTVHYDPESPDRAALQRFQRTTNATIVLPAGVVLALLGMYLLVGAPGLAEHEATIGAVGAGVLGVLLVAYAIRAWLVGRRSARWPTVDGRLRWARLRESYGATGASRYAVEVKYEYDVDGTTRTGSRIAFGGQRLRSKKAATRRREELESRSPIVVHYDPDDPDRSVLEPGGSGATVPMIAGVFIVAVGLFIAYVP